MSIPLRGPTPTDAYQGRRLLSRALVVVHFSPVMKIAESSGVGIAAFQDEVRGEYPAVALESEHMLKVKVRPDGIHPQMQEMPVWRFTDIESRWRISLTRETASLEVKGEHYSSAPDLVDRTERILTAIAKHFAPAQMLRVGVRFANAAPIADNDDPRRDCVEDLVRISGHDDLLQSDLLWRFYVDEGTLILRSGVLLPGTTYDQGVFEPSDERSWYLDVDVFSEVARPFSAEEIRAAVERQVGRVHAMYRWAIPSEAIEQEGSARE